VIPEDKYSILLIVTSHFRRPCRQGKRFSCRGRSREREHQTTSRWIPLPIMTKKLTRFVDRYLFFEFIKEAKFFIKNDKNVGAKSYLVWLKDSFLVLIKKARFFIVHCKNAWSVNIVIVLLACFCHLIET